MNQKRKILIVDDDPIACETLERLLQSDFFEICITHTGKKALELTEMLHPDLILLDVMMPEMDGFEVCQRIRSNPIVCDVPILMITALDDRESKLRGIELGADDYITKPFDRMELRLRIKTITKLNRYSHSLEEKKKIEKLMEFSPYGILVINNEGLIVLQNQKIQELLGLPGNEALMNKTFLSYLHIEEQHNFAHTLEEVKQGIQPKAKLESLLLNSNGFFLPVEMELAKFPMDSEEGIQINIRDITYEKNMCSKITILQKAVDQSSMMIMILDLDWKLTYINPEILRKTGFTEKEMLQNKFQVFYESDLNASALESIKKLRKEKKEWHGELKCRKKNGEILHEKTSIYSIKDFSGHCTHFVKIAEEKK